MMTVTLMLVMSPQAYEICDANVSDVSSVLLMKTVRLMLVISIVFCL